jgi:hypothetical protein
LSLEPVLDAGLVGALDAAVVLNPGGRDEGRVGLGPRGTDHHAGEPPADVLAHRVLHP